MARSGSSLGLLDSIGEMVEVGAGELDPRVYIEELNFVTYIIP